MCKFCVTFLRKVRAREGCAINRDILQNSQYISSNVC